MKIYPTKKLVVHEAYVSSLEIREQHLTAALRDALDSFKITQHPRDYPADDWCNRAEALLSNEALCESGGDKPTT